MEMFKIELIEGIDGVVDYFYFVCFNYVKCVFFGICLV